MILPVVIAMSASMNINVPAVTILLALGTHYAFVLPSACPAAGMMFSNPNLKPSFAYKTGLICIVICTVFVLELRLFLGKSDLLSTPIISGTAPHSVRQVW